ncbi:hypothetical protein EZS27_015204 [termite gut metagenome]|uniref:Uncharacterized protein n=1 Tax=termite gut metagenome TaxID=433724 RepID=A0A5J4RSV0_9ZZZZ
MERNKLEAILKENGYPEFMYDSVINKINKFNTELTLLFEAWVETKQSSQITKGGYSFEKLVTDFGMNPIGAFLTLDWLIREPDIAIKELKKGIK